MIRIELFLLKNNVYSNYFLGIYKLSLANNKIGITKEIMATKVIPFLVPLSIENGLSLQQV